MYNGTPDNKGEPYRSARDLIYTPTILTQLRATPRAFILPDQDALRDKSRQHQVSTYIKSYLAAYDILEDEDKTFVGSENVVLWTFKSKRIVVMEPLRDVNLPPEANKFLLSIVHYASLMFTNNYVHGIVPIANAFPKCAHIHLIDRTCYVQYYDLILDVFDIIAKLPKIYNPLLANNINIVNAPSLLPLEIRRDNKLGSGAQGSVFKLDASRVIKIIPLVAPSIFSPDYDLSMGERQALNEVLIMYYLKSRKFKHSPAPLEFGYFNSVFFYIIMERIDGKQPADDSDYALCQRSVNELHKMGILHTDLHAGNLLIRDTKTNCILLDYGFAHPKNHLPDSVKDEIIY